MARRTQTPQDPAPRDPSTLGGPAAGPRPHAETQGRAPRIAGRALVQTVRHFFPQLNTWLDHLPDSRVQQECTYSTRFLAWWGLRADKHAQLAVPEGVPPIPHGCPGRTTLDT
jgi:hypothetical protein